MGPRRVFLTVAIAAIFSVGVIHLGQRWLDEDGPAASAATGPRAAIEPRALEVPVRFASGEDWLHR